MEAGSSPSPSVSCCSIVSFFGSWPVAYIYMVCESLCNKNVAAAIFTRFSVDVMWCFIIYQYTKVEESRLFMSPIAQINYYLGKFAASPFIELKNCQTIVLILMWHFTVWPYIKSFKYRGCFNFLLATHLVSGPNKGHDRWWEIMREKDRER